MRLAYGLCLSAMLGLLAWMTLGPLAQISADAGGLLPFDLRQAGYGAAEARAFLAALSPKGRALYLGLQHQLDTVYPPLLALVLVWSYAALLPRAWAAVASLPALGGMGVDLIENTRVARILRMAQPDDVLIAAASQATVAKAGLIWAALLALVLALGYAGIRRLHRGRDTGTRDTLP